MAAPGQPFFATNQPASRPPNNQNAKLHAVIEVSTTRVEGAGREKDAGSADKTDHTPSAFVNSSPTATPRRTRRSSLDLLIF